jgi:peptide deformylase
MDRDEQGQRLHPNLVMPMVLLNPVVVAPSRKTGHHEEGCLSFPDIRADIVRPLEITLRYLDLDGQSHEIPLRDFMARVVQHEVDHLNGVLFIDRMSAPKRMVLAKRLRRMKQETEAALGLG